MSVTEAPQSAGDSIAPFGHLRLARIRWTRRCSIALAACFLATFPGLCVHEPSSGTITGTLAEITAPADRCFGRTKASGAWCRAWPMSGQRYCRAHRGQDAVSGRTSDRTRT